MSAQMPERIFAWYFHKGKQSEVMLGGWFDKKSRGDDEYVHSSAYDDAIARAAEFEAALKRTEANRDAAMEDAAEEYARAERLAALLAEAVEALQEISRQKKTDELETEYDVEVADFEEGYDMCVDRARATLARIQENRHE